MLNLERSFDLATINPATAMSLPLLAAVYVPPGSSFSLPHKVKQMKVSDVFQYDPHLHFLHWKAPRDPSLLQWKRAPGSVFRGLTSGQLKLQSYFAPVCRPAPPTESVVTFAPFVEQLQLAEGTSFVAATTSAKTFRAAVLSSVLSPMALRNIAPAQWKWFWSLSLTTIQRNVIYRLIAGCIPHRRLLHFIMPATYASPLCPVCLVTIDSAHHLLFDCPSKEQVWQGIIFEFLWPTTSLGDIKAALLSLDFSDIWYCQTTGIKPYRILLITLSQLWLAHMRFIFDHIPVNPSVILASIRSNVIHTIEEDGCHAIL
ncbi:hypothetical protein [Parasitella parasitica]|uniref:Reverse transcriptase zinc-binding domain-containing protein n=1 Tax=Parasitella parasitica TaxID=35722 RepID=A0A0B7N2W1_9FUNG|nr:hypothetical protein [Parasitella parasitica]